MIKEELKNKELLEKYPFLSYYNRQCYGENYIEKDYTYTALDELPLGWKNSFGEEMCEEIQQALIKENKVFDWGIVQLKEKYGEMRLYPNIYIDRIDNIIEKYTLKSMHTCCNCGKEAKWLSTGWISPYCDDCKNKAKAITFVSLEK